MKREMLLFRGIAAAVFVALLMLATSGPPAAQTANVRIAAGSDDAEEPLGDNNSMYDSSDIELVNETTSAWLAGRRFLDLQIPSGSTIVDARIQFTVDESDNLPAHTNEALSRIFGELDLDPVTFTGGAPTSAAARARWLPWDGTSPCGQTSATPAPLSSRRISRASSRRSWISRVGPQGTRWRSSFTPIQPTDPTVPLQQ